MRRWLRSLHAQLFLWAVLPVTFVIIAVAFTGVYAHQREMRDFVAERDLSLASLTARMIEDGLAHGVIGVDGEGLSSWLEPFVVAPPDEIFVVDAKGRALTHSDPRLAGVDLGDDPGVRAALEQQEGFVILQDDELGPMLATFAPIGGTGWLVLFQEPVEDIIGPILRVSSLAPVVAAGAGLLSLLVFTFGWRTIVRPLQGLARAAGQVSWGYYDAISSPVSGVQEVRDLHQALMDMVERIQSYQVGMRDYLGTMTRGQESERARLARELHDGPVQDLIVLGQRAEMTQRLVERGETARAQVLLEELRDAELQMIAELRRLIGALRPTYLEDLGLIPALELLVQQASGQTTAKVGLVKHGAVCRLDTERELAAYRIAQEALNNAVNYAHAQNITIHIQCDPENMTLSVVDDGVGFILPERPDQLTQASHFGLVGIRERATLMGGSLQITTAPGEGTKVIAQLSCLRPVQPQVAE